MPDQLDFVLPATTTRTGRADASERVVSVGVGLSGLGAGCAGGSGSLASSHLLPSGAVSWRRSTVPNHTLRSSHTGMSAISISPGPRPAIHRYTPTPPFQPDSNPRQMARTVSDREAMLSTHVDLLADGI